MDITPEERNLFKKLAQKSIKKRFDGKTQKEISEMMSKVRKARLEKTDPLTNRS